MAVLNPDLDWYASISRKKQLQTRCPFATADACPRFFQSLSLLRNAGTTSIDPDEDKRLVKKWGKSDLWPKTDEYATSISGPAGDPKHFSIFCPEVAFDRFGYFASDLCSYADELDTEVSHKSLSKEGTKREDWRWSWASVTPLHYTDCSLYSVLLHRSQIQGAAKNEPARGSHRDMSFDHFMTDRVTLMKQSGERIPDIPASVQKNKVFVNGASILIEPGDLLERVASNGLRETYEVVDPGFYEKFHGIEAHYQITVHRSVNVPTRPPIKKPEATLSSGFHPWGSIKNWWRGRWVDSTLESIFPGHGQAGSPDGHYVRPWLVRSWLALADYWKKHWQFTINALLTLIGIIVAAYVAIQFGK